MHGRRQAVSTAAQPARQTAQRRLLRHALAVPVDLIRSRSGTEEVIPARALDLGQGGLCAITAGELRPGDEVGVEFRLPQVGRPVRAQAIVRHQKLLRCGVEFIGLSSEQEALVRFWERRVAAAQLQTQRSRERDRRASWRRIHLYSSRTLVPIAWAALALFVGLGSWGWWQWRRGWEELESRLAATPALAKAPETQVAPGVMQQFITHKVEPIYPEAARRAQVKGIVVLEAVIRPDGTVGTLRPVSGPAILTPAAVEAVKWWRFRPYYLNGKASEVKTTLAVEFRP